MRPTPKQPPQYCRLNPGSVAFCEWYDNGKFRRAVFCPAMSANAIALCLPVGSMDGFHLRGDFECIGLMFAMLSPENEFVKMALALVSVEASRHWCPPPPPPPPPRDHRPLIIVEFTIPTSLYTTASGSVVLS